MDQRARSYRGIRYATADRLDEPVDTIGWDPDADNDAFGAQCPQNAGVLEQLIGGDDIRSSEDCHFLNVFTPACDDRKRPVMVWIHGGAFLTGSAAMPWYDGSALAARGDVVVVTINYRLGALGFSGERNLGSHDQVSALHWVQRNIADFGGDADNVTLFGESAGGASVLSLFAAPSARELFHAAWAMSPSILQLRTPEHAAEREATYLESLGDHEFARADVSQLLAAQAAMAKSPEMKDFAPTEHTALFPSTFAEALRSDVRPLVIGTTRDEMLLFTAFDQHRHGWNDDDVQRHFAYRFGADGAATAIERYRSARPNSTANELVSAMQTDQTFRRPAQQLADDREHATWMYLFDQRSTAFGGVFGACHGLDIPFAFDMLSAANAEMFTGQHDSHQSVADQFATALTQFAATHDPGWTSYDSTTRPTQRIGTAPTVLDDPESELRTLWI